MPVVLLVEDEADIRNLIALALAERGVEVRAAANDKAAYRALQREGPSISVLIADINLGEGSTGFDVARRARRANPRLEVIYITGGAAPANRST